MCLSDMWVYTSLESVTPMPHVTSSSGDDQSIMEEARNEIYIFSCETFKFLHVNKCARENLGYSLDEIKELTPLDIKPEYTESSFQDMVKPLLSGDEKKLIFTTPHQRKDGSEYQAEIHLQLGTYKGKAVYIAMILDVTERVIAEREIHSLLEQKATLAELLEYLNRPNLSMEDMLDGFLENLLAVSWLDIKSEGGIFISGLDGKLHLTSYKFLHKKLHTICAKISMGQCLCGRAAEQKKVIHAACVDDRHENRFDKMKPHGHYNVPILHSGKVLGVLVLYLEHGHEKNDDEVKFLKQVADLLALSIVRKQAELEIQDTNAELEEFAYRTSHDLRSPLISSIKLVELIQDYIAQGDREKASEALNLVDTSLNKLEALVADILELTQTQKAQEETQAIQIEELVEDALEKVGHHEGFSDITILSELEFTDDIYSKKSRLQLIVENLISNAVKYYDKNELEPFIKITSQIEGDDFVFSVEDNGLGIPEDKQDQMFTMFSRFHSKVSFGSGLGLYMIQKSAHVLSGRVTFEGLENGSRFSLRIPLARI